MVPMLVHQGTCLIAEVESSAQPGLLCDGARRIDVTPGVTTPFLAPAQLPTAGHQWPRMLIRYVVTAHVS